MKHIFNHLGLAPVSGHTDIPAKYKTEFINEIIEVNLKNEKLLSFVLIIVDLLLLSIDAAVSDLWTKNSHVFSKFNGYHIALFFIPLIFLLLLSIGGKINIRNVWFSKISHLLLITTVMILCALLAADNTNGNAQPFAYIVAMLCIASLILLENYEIWSVYVSAYIVYIIKIFKDHTDIQFQMANIMFFAVLIILVWAISKIRYTAFKTNFLDRKTILEKSEQLNEMTTFFESND